MKQDVNDFLFLLDKFFQESSKHPKSNHNILTSLCPSVNYSITSNYPLKNISYVCSYTLNLPIYQKRNQNKDI